MASTESSSMNPGKVLSHQVLLIALPKPAGSSVPQLSSLVPACRYSSVASVMMNTATFKVNDTFYVPFTSAYCGFDVYRTISGTINVTLFRDNGGALVRETDTGPDFKESFYAPSTGKTTRSEQRSTIGRVGTGPGAYTFSM